MIRHVGTPQAKCKSSFIAQAYKDKASGLLMYPPMMQCSYQTMKLGIVVDEIEKIVILLRDIMQEYNQTNEGMKRIVYLRPHPVLGFDPDILLCIERGFYVHPEARI